MNPGVVLHKVLSKTGAFGLNADTLEYGDLLRDGVLDPTKVIRTALENGSSVARILLSTNCIITEKPKSDDEGGASDEGMGDMDMDY